MSKCFRIHDILSQTNHNFVVTTIGISSFCVSFVKSIFVCETFSISFFFFLLLVVFFSALMLCKPGFYFLFRNNVSFNTVSGESKAVTSEMVARWNETTFPTLLPNYDLENIYNADEFGLFYQCLLDKSYQLKRGNVQVVNRAKSGSLVWQLPMPFAINCPKIQGVLKTLRSFSADIDNKKRA